MVIYNVRFYNDMGHLVQNCDIKDIPTVIKDFINSKMKHIKYGTDKNGCRIYILKEGLNKNWTYNYKNDIINIFYDIPDKLNIDIVTSDIIVPKMTSPKNNVEIMEKEKGIIFFKKLNEDDGVSRILYPSIIDCIFSEVNQENLTQLTFNVEVTAKIMAALTWKKVIRSTILTIDEIKDIEILYNRLPNKFK